MSRRSKVAQPLEGPCKFLSNFIVAWQFARAFFIAQIKGNIMKNRNKKINDEFTLYDLRVEVIKGSGKFVCNHKVGDYFELSGENLSIPAGQTFTIYALGSLLALLPAKQRMTNPNDFISTDADIACPDPNCGALFRIKRIRKRIFKHSDITIVPLKKERKRYVK